MHVWDYFHILFLFIFFFLLFFVLFSFRCSSRFIPIPSSSSLPFFFFLFFLRLEKIFIFTLSSNNGKWNNLQMFGLKFKCFLQSRQLRKVYVFPSPTRRANCQKTKKKQKKSKWRTKMREKNWLLFPHQFTLIKLDAEQK